MSKIYIGIDPDLKKSGVAVWDKDNKNLTIQLKTILELFSLLIWVSEKSTYYTVII